MIPSDTGFLLYIAGRVLDGARLYVDIIEINPPLIVGLNLPIVLAARALDVPEILVYRLAVAALVLACIGLTGRVLGYLFRPATLARGAGSCCSSRLVSSCCPERTSASAST